MNIKIEKRIVDYKVVQDQPPEQKAQADQETVREKPAAEVIHMHEKIERPPMLKGYTYKLKTPGSEHAMYVTINDIILNEGTEHQLQRPYEIFINSKNMDHFQWIVALTRIMSAVFRKGGDVTFLVEELRSVFDPRGGYFKKGGRYAPSLVAELGDVIETHLKEIGLLEDRDLDAHQQAQIDDARMKYDSATHDDSDDDFPATASLCMKCHTKALVQLDGCMTCLSCGDSKCG